MESDVEEVSVVEETPRVGQPLRPQPQAPKGGKGKLVLGAAAALVALACAYFFLTPKEEKAAAPLVPHTEKIGDSPSRQSTEPARETVAREVRVDQPASSPRKTEGSAAGWPEAEGQTGGGHCRLTHLSHTFHSPPRIMTNRSAQGQ